MTSSQARERERELKNYSRSFSTKLKKENLKFFQPRGFLYEVQRYCSFRSVFRNFLVSFLKLTKISNKKVSHFLLKKE